VNKENEHIGKRIGGFTRDNAATIIVLIFTVVGLFVSKDQSVGFFVNQLLERFFRNGFLVLALIIPVIAGLGLNFGIVAGAMAGMLSTIFIRYLASVECAACAEFYPCEVYPGCEPWVGLSGMSGLVLCLLLALPLAVLIGVITGRLYNKTRGQEMIASLIVGFFANGVYQLICLVLIGTLIPVDPRHIMIIPGGVGVQNTIDMGWNPQERVYDPEIHRVGMKYALDWIWRAPFGMMLAALGLGILVYMVIRRLRAKKNPAIVVQNKWVFLVNCVICGIVILLGLQTWLVPAAGVVVPGLRGIMIPGSFLAGVRDIPAVTGLVIVALCLFNHYFLKTKLGQDCRSVGQSQHIANVSGINVDRTRVIATVISTVLASWGMIVYMQNLGTVNTYGAYSNVGLFAVASILVGGASTSKATVKNAMIGVLLFNAMTIVSPGIGKLIAPNNANVEEYVRSFMVYGIIGLSLGLHVWKGHVAARNKNRLDIPDELNRSKAKTPMLDP